MIERVTLPVPLCLLHYQLLGGHRRMGFIALILCLVVAGTTLVLRHVFRDSSATVYPHLLNIIGFIQATVLLPGGCNAIYRAALRDYESKMIESHRLTPMTSFEVALGYVFGATLQLQLIALVLGACGVVITLFAGLPLAQWLVGHVVLFSAALPLWALVAASSMRAAKPISPAPFLVVALPTTAGIMALPGLGVLTGAYAVLIAYWIGTGANTLPSALVAAAVASNVFLAGYWVYIAATKYRRPDLPVLNGLRGLMLLLIWLGVAFGGVIVLDVYAGQFRWGNEMAAVQWIASLIASIPIGGVIVMATTECRAVLAQGRPPRGALDRFPDLPYAILAALLIAGITAFLAMIVPMPVMFRSGGQLVAPKALLHDPGGGEAVLRVQAITAVAFLFALLTIRGVYLFFIRGGRPRVKWPAVTTLGLLAALWSALPLLDLIRTEATRDENQRLGLSLLTTSSPGGAIGAAWSSVTAPIYTGLSLQAVIAILLSIVAARSWRRSASTHDKELVRPALVT